MKYFECPWFWCISWLLCGEDTAWGWAACCTGGDGWACIDGWEVEDCIGIDWWTAEEGCICIGW